MRSSASDEPPTVEATVQALGRCIGGLSHKRATEAVQGWLPAERSLAMAWARYPDEELRPDAPPHVAALIEAHRDLTADQVGDVWAPVAYVRLFAKARAAALTIREVLGQAVAHELLDAIAAAEQEGKRRAALMREMEGELRTICDRGAKGLSVFDALEDARALLARLPA